MNDFAASISIARDGFAQMAIAGAYAGPMFNILAGIGLPFLIKIVSDGGRAQKCGGEADDAGTLLGNPILWMSYLHLIVALTVTIIWVPLSGAWGGRAPLRGSRRAFLALSLSLSLSRTPHSSPPAPGRLSHHQVHWPLSHSVVSPLSRGAGHPGSHAGRQQGVIVLQIAPT